MNGYSLTEKMRKTRQWVRLTATEQALFHELVAVCNERNWTETFPCSNARLCRAIHISEQTLKKARESLINAGLLYYRCGKDDHQTSAYSFTTPFDESHTTSIRGVPTTSIQGVSTTSIQGVPTTSIQGDYINYNTIKPPSIPHESECVKNQLLTDETWKELIAMQSGLSIRFLEILPAQIDQFLQYIACTGEEHTIQTLSDAKRRFFWWWKNQGKKTYENNKENNESIVW